MIDPGTVADVFRERERNAGEALARMKEVEEGFKGDLPLAMPEINRSERPAAANLMYTGMTQTAMRIASPEPAVECRPVKAGIAKSEKNAQMRHRVIAGWNEINDQPALRLQRALWLISWHMAPVAIRPNKETGHPQWECKDPRRFFPSDGGLRPVDAVCATTRPYGWLIDNFPDHTAQLGALYKAGYRRNGHAGWDRDRKVRCLEWWSKSDCMFIALGDEREGGGLATEQKAAVLSRYPNLAGVTPVLCPTPVSLDPDDPRSQFDGMLGSYQMRSELLALSYLAVFKGVFPDEWAEPMQSGVEPDVTQIPDPRQGIIGVVKDGRINRQPTDPQFASGQMLDRLEGQERSGSSTPAEYGGNGATNVRTGRRGGQVMGAAIDYYIEAAQTRLAVSYAAEIETAALIDRAYFGNDEKELTVTMKGAAGSVKYRPNDLWETAKVRVRYPFAGSDISNITLEAGQLLGMEALSRQTLMEIHPLISDVEVEKDRITADRLERAAFAALEQQVADPAGPVTMTDMAEMRRLILTDRKEWWEAWGDIQTAKQEEQAAMAQGQVDPMSPEAMPGIDGQAMGPIADPSASIPGIEQLGAMLSKTRRPVMAVSGEAPAL